MRDPMPWQSAPSSERVVFDNLRRPGVPVINLLAVSDPDVHLVDGRWSMLAGAFTWAARVRIVRAQTDGSLDGRWRLDATRRPPRRGRLLAVPPRRSFDSAGMGSPAYAVGTDQAGRQVERIYYNGLDRLLGSNRTFAVGVLQRQGEQWVRRSEPVLTGDHERPSVLEPCVRYADGRWHMWFLSFVKDPPRGRPPDYRIRYASSADGLTGWSAPVEIFGRPDRLFDVDVRPWRGGWLMVVAGDPHADQAPQGLWMSWSAEPGDAASWRANLRPLLVHDDAALAWRRRGVYGPTIAEVSDERLTVFVSGHYGRIGWLAEARRRLAERRPPPPPTGEYFLSMIQLDFDARSAG